MSAIATTEAAPAPIHSRRARAGRSLLRPGTLVPLSVLLVALCWALAPGLFTTHSPTETSTAALQAPNATHWFGTDATGRDLFARVVYGARHTLLAALVAVSVGFVVGTVLGVVAGTVGGTGHRIGTLIEDLLMRFVDVLLAIPGLLLSLSIVILLGFGTISAAIAVGVTSIAAFARLARSEVLSVRHADFVEAAYGSGGSFLAVLWRHLLPNSTTAVVALAALQFGSAILQIATLGFLGYGTPPPTPEWGLLIAEGRDYIATAWWVTTLPGVVVAAVVLSTNRLSDAIRQGDHS